MMRIERSYGSILDYMECAGTLLAPLPGRGRFLHYNLQLRSFLAPLQATSFRPSGAKRSPFRTDPG